MQSESLSIFLLAYLLVNVLAFGAYCWDKIAAIEGRWRVRESTLLTFAFVGGSLGAIVAQQLFNHKTRKEPFRTYLAAIVVLHIVLGLAALFLFSGTAAFLLKTIS
ncbi:DUF1294 domain-containing protein [Rhizobium sp. XQZ8]|uniref:DUF1294 domain-containing protein n=1 Tax=Rhizobium populisoli TaxID=2859785 RepID=UPI001C67CB9F|nr:DUF1294 domain-containing protein [Rhizobium populisoli]MBW6420335.1 DUF1294 domain-containing protein [Rhizobium populisoli]